MTRTKPQGVLWVCIRCLFAREYAEELPDQPADLPEVWSLLADTEVTMGMAWAKHTADCPNRHAASTEYDCDGAYDCSCETDSHSTRACDACGDSHHGERHAYTWWE